MDYPIASHYGGRVEHMNLEHPDRPAILCIVCAFIILVTWPILGVYLMPIEWALRNTPLSFILLGVVWIYSFKEKRQIEHRLRNGWTVRGNITE